MTKKVVFIFWVAFLVLPSEISARTLVTIESQKARLTLSLLVRLLKLEEHLKNQSPLKILVLLPRTKTAFQDQNIVNQTIKDFFAGKDEFVVYWVSDGFKAKELLQKADFKVFYVAGPVPNLEELLALAARKKVLTVSHLPELIPMGLALSLDLERRRACIVVNPKIWPRLGLKFPKLVEEKFCFAPTE